MKKPNLSEARLKAWQRRSAWPLIALSLLYTFVYVFPIYWYPVSNNVKTLCITVEYLCWAVFVADYVVQFKLAQNRRRFLKSEWLALLLVAIPFFRPIRAIRGIVFARQASTRPRESMVASIPWIISSIGLLMMIIMGAAVLNVERFAPGGNIKTPSDALWWALVTVTTIGYGDRFPVTNEGRLLAAVLIVFGIGLLASLTGYIASWIISQSKAVEEENA